VKAEHRRQVVAQSGYRGVTRRHARWVATISINGKVVTIGTFDSAIEAARAFDARARQLGRVNLNFPDEH
jgi:hypothetical protein